MATRHARRVVDNLSGDDLGVDLHLLSHSTEAEFTLLSGLVALAVWIRTGGMPGGGSRGEDEIYLGFGEGHSG